jgi:predicted PurR-regulated permease PerM
VRKNTGPSLPSLSGNRALVLLAYTTIGAVVLAGLYWLQPVLIPLALGILIATVLAPVLKALERSGLSRAPAVATIVTLGAVVAGGLVWLIYAQTTQLLIDLPKYDKNIVEKVNTAKSFTRATWREKWDHLVGRINEAVQEPTDTPATDSPPRSAEKTAAAPATVPASDSALPSAMAIVLAVGGQTAGQVALAVVVAIFLLVDREDLRNRVIQLIGRGQVAQTTRALDDAGKRLGRFLLVQAIVNASYGVVLAVGLACLGVNYAILWGILAAVLRYIPYVGGTIATVFPVVLSLAQFSSWWPALSIIALVIVQEVIVNNFVEPRLFGQSIGVSSVALIIAAAFWVFLWGPVGLVMAGPLTVCLVVLGHYVPALRFLGVLLGNQTLVDQEIILYQRLLAKDELETQRIMEEALEEESLPAVYDKLVFPAATAAGLDRQNGLLSREDEEYIYDELEELTSTDVVSPAPEKESNPPARAKLLLVAARDLGDRLVVGAVKNTLDPGDFHCIQASDGLIGAEIVNLAQEEEVDGICILSLPPGGLNHSKYLCKRLRVKLPRLKIFLGHMDSDDAAPESWSKIGADVVSFSLVDLVKQLEAWKPVLDFSGQSVTVDPPARLEGPHTTAAHQLVLPPAGS